VSDPNDEFSSLLSIFRGSPLVVKDSSIDFMLAVARELSNLEPFRS
jgi:hypothetical protein